MTPAERAVIDAARAWAAGRERSLVPDGDLLDPCEITLYRAVRALPRPLSEQLAELRVGDLVETGEGVGAYRWPVVVNIPSRAVAIAEDTADGRLFVLLWGDIRRIISNPEADRG